MRPRATRTRSRPSAAGPGSSSGTWRPASGPGSSTATPGRSIRWPPRRTASGWSPVRPTRPSGSGRWPAPTPRGHYDTSIAGDRKFLGWLTNRGVDNSPNRLLAGQFDTIDKFEKRFRQPKAPTANALDRLLDTGDPIQAASAAPAVPADVAG